MEQTKWISVDERLPELTEPLMGYNDDDVLEVMLENYQIHVLGYDPEIGWFKAQLTKRGWREVSSISTRASVKPTHWAPAPQPPQT